MAHTHPTADDPPVKADCPFEPGSFPYKPKQDPQSVSRRLVRMGSVRMPFGKHRGKTLSMIGRIDVQYLRWIADTKDFNPADLRDTVLEYLKHRSEGWSPSWPLPGRKVEPSPN